MLVYVFKRLMMVIPTLIGVAVAVFFLIRVMPGDPVVVKLRADGAAVTEETIQAERKRLGLDKPLIVQFKDYMIGLVKLDLGKSLWTGQSVAGEIALRFPVSLEVAILSTLIALVISIPLGILSAVYKDSLLDNIIRILAVSGLAIPGFWLGMLIILGLLNVFHWLPKIGYVSIFEDPVANLTALIWPAISVGYRYAAVATRMMRSALLEVLREDYIRTARAKGVYERLVTRRHALRNALLPVVTVIGLEFAFLIGGLVVTEQVFNLNGIGKLFVDATARGDFTLIQGLVIMIATIFVLVNLVIDLFYAYLDPRIRLS
ncbi:MAG: ABC transporter permease [Hyphomicrobiaceae bacterium]